MEVWSPVTVDGADVPGSLIASFAPQQVGCESGADEWQCAGYDQ